MDEMSFAWIGKNARKMFESAFHLDDQPVMIAMRMQKAMSNVRGAIATYI